MGVDNMVTIAQGEWIADLGAMYCRNINTGIIVSFEKSGNTLIGKVKDMPIELLRHWAMLVNGHKLMQKAVMEAEEVFLRAYVESDIEKKWNTGK